MTNWEEVNVPKGAYLGWANKPGQTVIGKVVDYNENGGTNFAGEPCPSATIELTEDAASFNKEGERTDFAAGELVQLNAGQVSLKRALRAADPKPGDLVKITLENIAKTSSGGTVKEYGIKIARGAGGAVTPKAAAPVAADDNFNPPF
jgi:hypothetical protein